MLSPESHAEPLRLLIADHRGWIARSLINVLDEREWNAVHCHGALDLLRSLAHEAPHAIALHDDLEDMPLDDLLPRLRGEARVDVLTPIVVLSTRAHRGRRLELLRAGATEHFLFPSDPESLLLRLRSLAQAGREAERLRRAALIEPGTELYTELGIARRAREIATDATRRRDPLSCVVIATPASVRPESGERPLEIAIANELGAVVRRTARTSDAVGRVGNVVVVIAPATGQPGAQRLAERIHGALALSAGSLAGAPRRSPVRGDAPESTPPGERQFRAAYCSIADFSRSSIDLTEMIERATAALAAAAATPEAPAIVGESVSVSDQRRAGEPS